jgi:hypothetical protein
MPASTGFKLKQQIDQKRESKHAKNIGMKPVLHLLNMFVTTKHHHRTKVGKGLAVGET